MRYAITTEAANGNFFAHVPDLPGCIATGDSAEDAEASTREAIEFHFDGLRAGNLPVPAASSRVDYVEVAA